MCMCCVSPLVVCIVFLSMVIPCSAMDVANPNPFGGAPAGASGGEDLVGVLRGASGWASDGSSPIVSAWLGGGSAQPLRGESTAGAVGSSGLSPASRSERAGGCASGPGESHRAPSDTRRRLEPLQGPQNTDRPTRCQRRQLRIRRWKTVQKARKSRAKRCRAFYRLSLLRKSRAKRVRKGSEETFLRGGTWNTRKLGSSRGLKPSQFKL